MVKWTFKTLRFTESIRPGEPLCEWIVLKARFETIQDAATAAAGYMAAHAADGNMVVVSLEPAPGTLDDDPPTEENDNG